MNAQLTRPAETTSLPIPAVWRTTRDYSSFRPCPPLENDITLDCAIVGGGLAGILTAYLLAESGLRCALFEEGELLSGKSGRTTAKATVGRPFFYSSLDPDRAKKAAAAYSDGLNLLKSLTAKIKGSAKTTDVYFYEKYGSTRLRREYETMQSAGISCAAYSKNAAPIPDENEGAIRIYDQLTLDVPTLAYGLCLSGKFKIYENSPAESITAHSLTVGSHTVRASNVICATNYPAHPDLSNPIKYYRKTSSVIKSEPVDCEILENSAAYCCDCGYGIRRSHDGGLMVSGVAQREAPTADTFAALEDVLHTYAPHAKIELRWTNNDVYTHDLIPSIGRQKSGVIFSGGFSGWGMTASAVSAIITSELVKGREIWYADMFSPNRGILPYGTNSLTEHTEQAASGMMKKYGEPHLTPHDLKPGEGGIVSRNGKRTGAYRDENGSLYYTSISCPHMGCELQWNSADRTWDCPCHGTRLTYDGKLIHASPRIE